MELILLSCVLMLLLAFLDVSLSKKKNGLPPSPFALPVIGHLHLLGSQPHQSLQKLAKKHGDYLFLKLGTVKTLVVTSPEAANEILKTQDHVFASRPDCPEAQILGLGRSDVVFGPYGDNWRQMKKICTLQLLTSRRVEMFHPVRRAEVSAFLRSIFTSASSKSEVDLRSGISGVTFSVLLRLVMSQSISLCSSEQEFQEVMLVKEMLCEAFQLASCFHVSDFFPWLKFLDTSVGRMEAVRRRMENHLQQKTHQRRRQVKEEEASRDFLDVMLQLSAEGKLSDTSVKALILDMLAAGTDTTAVIVEWGLAEVLKNPVILSKAREELDEVIGRERTLLESDIPKLPYLQAVVKETLRLHPSLALLVPHESVKDTAVSGYSIPAKTRVIINAYAIARDERAWEEPLKFDPQRFVVGGGDSWGSMIPFGGGRRMCPGMQLGVVTVQLLLGSLLHSFEWESGDGKGRVEDLDMSERFGLTLPRASPLKLVPSTRLKTQAYLALV